MIGTDALTKDQWAEIQTKVTKGGANIMLCAAVLLSKARLMFPSR